ncbi:MAG: DUF4446 family protein [Actinobacteria bacterium]|nr:DUF4446 family protein [Actinomycetota bacterium]
MTIELTIAIVALAVGVAAFVQSVVTTRRIDGVPDDEGITTFLKRVDNEIGSVTSRLNDLEPRLRSVETRLPLAIARTAVIEFNAYGDIGGNLSRVVALLDESATGLVITLLVGRTETRFFTKQVRNGKGTETLSDEESQAIATAIAPR